MRTRFAVSAATLTVLALASAVTPLVGQKKGAATAVGGDIISQMSASDVTSLLRDMGYDPQGLEGRDNAWTIELSGRRAVVMLSSSGQNLALWSYVTGSKVTLEKINEWNKTKRFSRAYLDSDGDPNVEWDIDLEGGVSLGAVREGIRTFGLVIDAFKDFF